MALVDQYGRPIKTTELKREIAAPTLAGVRTLWDASVASGLTPQGLAALLQSAAQGDHDAYLTLAEEMEERDLHYAAELSKRKLAVSRLPISVEAATDAAADQKLADEVSKLVRRAGMRGLLKGLLDALGKGFAVAEILWDRSGSTWVPQRYVWRDPHFFQFERIARQEIRLRDDSDLMDGLPLPPYKFITHVPRIKSGIPIRGGLARLAAWAYMCKGYTVKDWLAFAEVFGMPLRLGKYGSGASKDDIAVLKMAVANLGIDAAAVFPESMQIELVEAGGKAGSADFFERLANYLDAQVSKGVLGQTASSSGTPGRLGNDDLQAEVRDDIRDDDAEQLAETLSRDLVKPFVDLNWGPQAEYPRIVLAQPDADDIELLISACEKLVPLGLRVEQSVIRDKIGLPDPDPDAKPGDFLQAPTTAPQPALNHQKALNAEQAAAPGQAALDALADEQIGAAADHFALFAAEIVRAIEQADSYEQAMDALMALWPQLDSAVLERIIGQGLLAATIGGRQVAHNGEL